MTLYLYDDDLRLLETAVTVLFPAYVNAPCPRKQITGYNT